MNRIQISLKMPIDYLQHRTTGMFMPSSRKRRVRYQKVDSTSTMNVILTFTTLLTVLAISHLATTEPSAEIVQSLVPSTQWDNIPYTQRLESCFQSN